MLVQLNSKLYTASIVNMSQFLLLLCSSKEEDPVYVNWSGKNQKAV
jgi:hypothetical protein